MRGVAWPCLESGLPEGLAVITLVGWGRGQRLLQGALTLGFLFFFQINFLKNRYLIFMEKERGRGRREGERKQLKCLHDPHRPGPRDPPPPLRPLVVSYDSVRMQVNMNVQGEGALLKPFPLSRELDPLENPIWPVR